MSTLANSSWKFSIENLGGLEHGDVDVKPLTLLCGPNNTGKTWVMYAIYGFLNNSSVDGLHGIDSLVSELQEQGISNFDIKHWLENNFKQTINAINKSSRAKLPNTFNSSDELFSTTEFNWKTELNSLLENSNKNKFNKTYSLGGSSGEVLNATKEKGCNIMEMTLLKDVPKSIIKKATTYLIYSHLLDKNGKQSAFLIPAERNGLHLFYRELSSRRTALLHHASRDELDLSSLLKDVLGSRYAKPIADYIDWLNELTTIKKNASRNNFHDLAEELKKLVGGKYHIDSDGNITFIPKKKRNGPATPKMDLHLTSSTVKSLFGLWFYLEYQAEDHSVLMIDEPELNLHPSNQRAVARFIAKMVNRGINVMISTHSDYFVRELNSLIMLGSNSGNEKSKANILKKYSISEDMLLNKEKIVAYVFDSGTLQTMDVNEEGIIATTFDEQINQLNDSSDEIYYSYVLHEED